MKKFVCKLILSEYFVNIPGLWVANPTAIIGKDQLDNPPEKNNFSCRNIYGQMIAPNYLIN